MPKNDSIQSLQRAVQILYAVAGSEDGRTVGQVAAAVSLKSNTAYRFIRTLEKEGMLSRREQPLRFTIGQAVRELSRMHDDRHLLTVAAKVLVATSARMPEGNFEILEQDSYTIWQRLCVEAIRPGVLIRRRSFAIINVYRKSSFLLFLAYATPAEKEAVFRAHPFDKEGKPVWGSKQGLEDYLEKVRRLKYSCPECVEDDGPTTRCRIAFPVFSSGHELIAAVAAYFIGTPSKEMRRQLFAHCRQAALKIQEGFQKPSQ
jgi:DNA-binding IclR family transcriptional regulator